MLLSIIIPVYNTEKFLEKCVISCENQDIPKDNYELIIVNDGSTDNSSNITKSLSEEFSNIVLYYQSNAGLSSARNVGIKLAKGDYIMFVDSDDWIAENCLGKICDNIKTNWPDALAICSANVYDDCISLRNSYNSGSIIRGRDFLKKEQVPDGAPFAIWNRNFFEENHFKFKEGIFHEDSELIPKVYYMAESVSCINDIISLLSRLEIFRTE